MRFSDDPDDPYSAGTVMGWIRSWNLGKAIQADLADQEGIEASIAEMRAAEEAGATAFWAQMRADGVPVAQPDAEPEAGNDPGSAPAPEPEAQ